MDCEVAVGWRLDRGQEVTDLLPYAVAALALALVVALGWRRPIVSMGDEDGGEE